MPKTTLTNREPPTLSSLSVQIAGLEFQSTTLIALSVCNGLMNIATIAIAYVLANA